MTSERVTKVTLADGSMAVHMPGTVWRVFSADGRGFRDFPTLELAKSSTVLPYSSPFVRMAHPSTVPSGRPEMKRNVTLTRIVQTTVLGVHAYHGECECGWTSKRYDREVSALKASKRHAERHAS